MNFLDQFRQDQEAAKSDLNSMMNQKAFDLLDSYAVGDEVEVVTFSDEEAALTEEELDEMTDEEFDSIDEEQLDELSKATLASYTKKALPDGRRRLRDNPLKADNIHKTVNRIRGTDKALDRLTKEEVEDLDEGLGNLAGLSKHLIKTVTGSVYNGRSAGEHSEVEAHSIKNKSAHRAVLNKALDDGHVPVVYVNGKIHSAGHSTGSSYGRTEFNIHDADKQKEQKETIYPKPRRYGGKIHYSEPYHTSNPRYKKGDALDQLTPGHEASFYKDNKVEVKVVKADKVRMKVRADRHAAAPATQDNYVNSKPGDKKKSTYIDHKTKTSTTSAGDNLKAVKNAAALRLATKKLGGDSASANKKAMDLHAELGKHLAAGKHKEAIHTASALADHVRNQGLTTHADKIADYAKSLKDLKSHYDKSYAKKTLARLRGVTNESEELVEALELMLTEMLDANEAVVPGSVKKDKDGNVLTFKTVPDKKLVTDRKTGKQYDPEKEFDRLISKKNEE